MLNIPSPFHILDEYGKEDQEELEMFNQAMKEHLADERESMASDMVSIRASRDNFMKDILSGDDDRDFSE